MQKNHKSRSNLIAEQQKETCIKNREDPGGGEGKGSPKGLNKQSLAQSVQQPSKSSST
jgi:hypothetical protein